MGTSVLWKTLLGERKDKLQMGETIADYVSKKEIVFRTTVKEKENYKKIYKELCPGWVGQLG